MATEQRIKGRKRTGWFKLIALLLPLVLLLTVEGLLRLFHYGYDPSLFVKDPDNEAYYVMNPAASAIYFSDSVNATRGNIERFHVRKAPGALRIFVLGESTTAGYPYMHNGSFHRWLQYRLLHSFPDREIELVNVSLTAVNSYTVLDFGRQVLDYQPDAVLVYTGHNEYYGALGVGSTSHIAGSRFIVRSILWLRHFRTVQGLQRCIAAVHGVFSHKDIDTKENLMQRMAQEQRIPFGSADYYTGVRQFHDNMDDLCRLFADAHVPVFLSTLVSNEKDLPPFISAPGNDITTATGQFRKGDSCYQAGAFALAKQAYRRASELDLLRFRAPDTLNAIIKQLCFKYSSMVHLVDSRALFESYSPHGILGVSTLLEHVHPNLFGYALLSDAFYRALRSTGFPGPATGSEMALDSLLRYMPVTRVDSLNGAYQVMMLRTRWPFNEPMPAGFVRGNTVEEQLAGALAVGRITWMDAMDQLFKSRMQAGDKTGALQAVEAVMLEHPENTTYMVYCGRLSYETGRFEDALLYFKRLYRMDSSAANTQTLLIAYIKMRKPALALALVRERTDVVGDAQRGYLERGLSEIIRLENSLKTKDIAENDPARVQLEKDYKLLGAGPSPDAEN